MLLLYQIAILAVSHLTCENFGYKWNPFITFQWTGQIQATPSYNIIKSTNLFAISFDANNRVT